MPASHFQDFCRIFIEFFEDESDSQKRWKHVASLLVEEVTRPATLGDDAYEHLRGNMRPVFKQEGLSGVGSAFFGGINDSDTELLLEQVELFLEDPDAAGLAWTARPRGGSKQLRPKGSSRRLWILITGDQFLSDRHRSLLVPCF